MIKSFFGQKNPLSWERDESEIRLFLQRRTRNGITGKVTSVPLNNQEYMKRKEAW